MYIAEAIAKAIDENNVRLEQDLKERRRRHRNERLRRGRS